ncbi:hypothetical protein C2S52_000784 [Perilla frutescens var. hirtella]|nr:hypothetical protein C2S52_000784 [Perilla frutescens var. hirtella]
MEEEDQNLAAQLQQEDIQRSRSQSQQFNVNDPDTQESETPEVEMPMQPHSGQAPQFTYQPSGIDREMPHISKEASKRKVTSDIFLIHFKKIPVPKQNEHDEQKFIAKCNYSGKEYPHRIGGGYGTFKKHLKIHPVEMGLARGQTQMQEFTSSNNLGMSNETPLFRYSDECAREKMARLCAINSLPFQFGDSLNFEYAMQHAYNPTAK